MITVAEVLNKVVLETPFLEEGIADGIINLSALARKVRPQVEKTSMKPVSESAILMALKRMSPKLTKKIKLNKQSIFRAGDLTVRSDLSEFTFLKSDTLVEKQKALLHEIKERADHFVTFTQGVFEITTIVNADLTETVETIFKGEKVISQLGNLAAITIRLSPQTVHTPGVHYSILKQLALRDINVVEVVSTYTEFTIILEKDHVDVSFSVLLKFLSNK